MKFECNSKKADLVEKYDEDKRKTIVEKLMWRVGKKGGNYKDKDKNNIICTNHLV